jgi:phage terminase large subunit
MRATRVFRSTYQAQQSGHRFIVNQGGARSSKTLSLCQLFIALALQCTGEVFSVVRKTMPSLRGSVVRDFFGLLEQYGLYNPANHNRTEEIYTLHGNEIEFFGLDQPQKVRGRKRKYLWMNEANELTYEDFTQLNLRTTGQIFLDYNPSDETHWIYEQILPREDSTLIQSTYKDNPFLEPELVKEIERLKDTDENYWTVYGLGLVGHRLSRVWTRYDVVPAWPEGIGEEIYGLDFGFNNPSALVRIGFKDGELFVQELLYRSGLTNSDLTKHLLELIPEGPMPVYADSAEPQRIEEIFREVRPSGNRINILPMAKGPDSVSKGIDSVKQYMVHLVSGSENLIREWKKYSWKTDKNGKVLDEPIKFDDHCCDAVRGAIQSYRTKEDFKVLFAA